MDRQPPLADALTRRNRDTWSSGDWDAVAQMVTEVGPRLLDLVDLRPGARVLDVGTGSGTSVAIPTARRGARVIASDLTDAWFDAGRRHAAEAGVELDWVVGDAANLPFPDASFDVVLSTFGHMFAPDHQRAADELVRVCCPGGSIAFATWRATGFPGQMFRALRDYLPPPPPGVQPPSLWGDRTHITSLFAAEPTFVDGHVVRPIAPAPEFTATFATNFGPLVAARPLVGDRWAELQRRLAEVAAANTGPGGLRSDYLLTVLMP